MLEPLNANSQVRGRPLLPERTRQEPSSPASRENLSRLAPRNRSTGQKIRERRGRPSARWGRFPGRELLEQFCRPLGRAAKPVEPPDDNGVDLPGSHVREQPVEAASVQRFPRKRVFEPANALLALGSDPPTEVWFLWGHLLSLRGDPQVDPDAGPVGAWGGDHGASATCWSWNGKTDC